MNGRVVRYHPSAQGSAFFVVDALQGFRSHAGHVDTRRALFSAGFAGETREQHLFYLLYFVLRPLSLVFGQELPQHIRSCSGGLQLIAARFVGRTHRTAYDLRLAAVSGTVALLHTAEQLIAGL